MESYRVGIGAPTRVDLRDQANLRMSAQLVFVPAADASRIIQAFDVSRPDDVAGIVLDLANPDLLGVLRFIGKGFVDPDGLKPWTQDDLLDSIRTGVAAANAQTAVPAQEAREARAWIDPPSYDPEAHRYQWSVLVVPKSAPAGTGGIVTHNTVLFGRQGYFHLEIMAPHIMAEDQKRMAGLVSGGFRFVDGKDFRDFRGGDPIAAQGPEAILGVRTLHKAAGPTRDLTQIMLFAGGTVAAIALSALGFLIYRVVFPRKRRRRLA